MRAYCRCNSGHYFQGEFCPFDGWSSAAARELTAAIERLAVEGQLISVVGLRQAGVSRETLERIMVIEFGSPDSVFEAMDPRGYVINGESKTINKLGQGFK